MKRYLLLLTWLLSLPASAQLLDGLTGYYSFEAQTNGMAPNAARDLASAGFTNDGARLLGGDPIGGGGGTTVPLSTVAGTFRAGAGALACDGVGDYARLDAVPVNVLQDYTVSLWFKPDTGGLGITGAVRSFVIETKPGFVISFGLRAGTAGNTNFQLFTDAGTDPSASFNVPNAEVDQWHHLVIRYAAGSQSVQGYIDGVQRYNLAFTGSPGNATGVNSGTYRTADTRWYKGFIDEEIFWQRALTEEEIAALFAAGGTGKSFAALSGESEHAELRTNLTAYYTFDSETNREVTNSAVALGAPGFAGDTTILVGDYTSGPVPTIPPITNDPAMARSGNGAFLADGINNYVAIDGNPVDVSQSFTVSVWFKPDTGGQGYGGAATRAFIYESAGADSYAISFGLREGTAPGTANFQLFTLQAAGTSQTRDFVVANENVDQWHHYLETYDVATSTIVGYLDGAEVHRIAGLTPLKAYTGFRLGTYRTADARWFKGLIDEVAFWQRPLTVEEISQIYFAGSEGISLPDSGSGGGNTGLAVTGFAKAPGGSGYRITWRSVPGLKYTLEASSDLVDWSLQLVSDYVAPGASVTFDIVPDFPAPEGALYDPFLSDSPGRFYRVKRKN